MNKLTILIPFYKRHDLTELCFKAIRKQATKYKIDVYVCGSEGASSEKLAKKFKFKYLECENNPVGNKFNSLLGMIKGKDYDGAIVIGSDNFISDSIIEHYLNVKCTINAVYGFNDIHFYSTKTRVVGTGVYDRSKMTIGVGRLYTKKLLNKSNHTLWIDSADRGLDGGSINIIKGLGAKEIKINYSKKYMILDVKHSHNISSHDIVDACDKKQGVESLKDYFPYIFKGLSSLKESKEKPNIKTDPQIKINNMEKVRLENKARVVKAKKVNWSKQPSEVVVIAFKSKHLKEGQEYTITKETAEILVNKGAAKLK